MSAVTAIRTRVPFASYHELDGELADLYDAEEANLVRDSDESVDDMENKHKPFSGSIKCRYRHRTTGKLCAVVVPLVLEKGRSQWDNNADNFEALTGALFKTWEREHPTWKPLTGERAHFGDIRPDRAIFVIMSDALTTMSPRHSPAASSLSPASPSCELVFPHTP